MVTTDTIHSCSPFCTRPGCVAGREQGEALEVARTIKTCSWVGTDVVHRAADILIEQDATITAQAARIAELERDAARLDWLDKNIFHREIDSFDKRLYPGSIMWVTFAPQGTQGTARRIIDAAMQQGERNE